MQNISAELREFIKQCIPDAKSTSNGKEMIVRCTFCGDSKNKRSKHMYIFLGDNTKPPMYHCFKCGESGILTKQSLRKIIGSGSISSYVFSDLDKVSASYTRSRAYRPDKSTAKYNLNYMVPIEDSKRNQAKKSYIEHRLGVSISYEELQQLKVVLDMNAILSYNGLQCKSDFWKQASSFSIGFITMDNAYINLRNILKDPKKPYDFRYANYNIFDSETTTAKFYCIPTAINITPEPIHLRIAEGAFDILSVYFNLMNKEMRNNIYIATNGKGFYNVILYMVTTYPLGNIILDLYLDNDVESSYVSNIIEFAYTFNIPVYLHRNVYENEKDFGVPKDRIIDMVTKG